VHVAGAGGAEDGPVGGGHEVYVRI
jgi:hypothetical protein